MEKKTEHHRFYYADFKREAEWLREESREGWHLVDTDGATFELEKGTKEDWIYRTDDFKDGDDPNTFLDKYTAKGWKFVCRANHRVYFRKKNIGKDFDYSVFTDDAERLAYSKKLVNMQTFKMVPVYFATIVYLWVLLFTPLMKNTGEIPFAIFSTIGFALIIVFSFGVGMHLSEYKRWKKVKKEMDQPEVKKEMSLEEAIDRMEDGEK